MRSAPQKLPTKLYKSSVLSSALSSVLSSAKTPHLAPPKLHTQRVTPQPLHAQQKRRTNGSNTATRRRQRRLTAKQPTPQPLHAQPRRRRTTGSNPATRRRRRLTEKQQQHNRYSLAPSLGVFHGAVQPGNIRKWSARNYRGCSAELDPGKRCSNGILGNRGLNLVAFGSQGSYSKERQLYSWGTGCSKRRPR